MKLAALQQAFVNDLRGHDDALAELVVEQGNISNETRLGIYRNAYRVRFIDVLSNDHEMLMNYIGEEAFAELVGDYTAAYPSQAPSLRNLGDHLPDFLAAEERYATLPILAELAHFERRLLKAFDAADADSVGLAALQDVPADDWPSLQVTLHPSVQLFPVGYNTVEVWQALKQEQDPPPITEAPACWLLWRNADRLTEFRSMPADEVAALTSALAGSPFSDVCEALLEWLPAEQVAARAAGLMQTWMEAGVVSALRH